jgi:Arc/MetJ-type ribon-helix-helix transcriptional regulator
MTNRKANYSMYLPAHLRKKIERKVKTGHYSSIAGFFLRAAEDKLEES